MGIADEENLVTVTRRIDAPAATIFAIVADPGRHQEFDGTGMVRGPDAAATLTGVGDTFIMQMFNDEFGSYTMLNRVVEFEPDRRISWAPSRHDVDEEDWHHRWGYDLEPDDGATLVTEFFDCRESPAEAHRILKNGTRWREAMQESLERLDALATTAR